MAGEAVKLLLKWGQSERQEWQGLIGTAAVDLQTMGRGLEEWLVVRHGLFIESREFRNLRMILSSGR
jgi:hypothetical protein